MKETIILIILFLFWGFMGYLLGSWIYHTVKHQDILMTFSIVLLLYITFPLLCSFFGTWATVELIDRLIKKYFR